MVNSIGCGGFRYRRWIPLDAVVPLEMGDSVGVGGLRWRWWLLLEAVDYV
jgi:hypothetical protein